MVYVHIVDDGRVEDVIKHLIVLLSSMVFLAIVRMKIDESRVSGDRATPVGENLKPFCLHVQIFV